MVGRVLTEEEIEDLLDALEAFEGIEEILEGDPEPMNIDRWEDFKAELDADTSSPKDR